MGDSASARWRLCKCSFIFEGANDLVENYFWHATQKGCIATDPTAKPYFKHFSNRDELSIIQGANSCETANLQMPSRFVPGLRNKCHRFWTTTSWLATTLTNKTIQIISSNKIHTLLLTPTFGSCFHLLCPILRLATKKRNPKFLSREMLCVTEILHSISLLINTCLPQITAAARVL